MLKATLLLLCVWTLSLQARAQSVERVLLKSESGHHTYIVNERAPSLSAVARELYGDRRMAVQIARWNKLPSEAWLKLGDRLRIERAPKYSAEQGTALLIRYWHIAGRQDLVARLKGIKYVPPRPVAKAAPKFDYPLKGYPPIMGARWTGSSTGVSSYVTVPAPNSVRSRQVVNTVVEEQEDQVTVIKRRQASVGSGDEAGGEPKTDGYWLGMDATRLIETITRKIELLSKKKSEEKPKQ